MGSSYGQQTMQRACVLNTTIAFKTIDSGWIKAIFDSWRRCLFPHSICLPCLLFFFVDVNSPPDLILEFNFFFVCFTCLRGLAGRLSWTQKNNKWTVITKEKRPLLVFPFGVLMLCFAVLFQCLGVMSWCFNTWFCCFSVCCSLFCCLVMPNMSYLYHNVAWSIMCIILGFDYKLSKLTNFNLFDTIPKNNSHMKWRNEKIPDTCDQTVRLNFLLAVWCQKSAIIRDKKSSIDEANT